MVVPMPRCLTEPECELVKKVGREVGEIPAASLEVVLLRGNAAKRFQAINEIQLGAICDLADRANVALPTRTIYAH